MQHTTCTEDRIYHALERCLHGLSRDAVSSRWAGRSPVNHELVLLSLYDLLTYLGSRVRESCWRLGGLFSLPTFKVRGRIQPSQVPEPLVALGRCTKMLNKSC